MALKPTKKTSATLIMNVGEYTLAEPSSLQRFPSQEQVKVFELTPWIEAQIEAGLFAIVSTEEPAAEAQA